MILFELYLQVEQSSQSSALKAKLFPGRPNDYIAKGTKGEPTVLIANSGGRNQVAPIELRNLIVEYAVPMEVHHETGVTQGTFIVLAANHNRPDLYEAFCAMVEAAVSGLTSNPTSEEVEHTVQALIELFRAAISPPKKTVVGLWGELLLIDASPDPTVAIRAWHVTPFDTHDFVFGSQAIEVKSTERTERIHEFNHNQLVHAAGKTVLIISVLLRRSSTGYSCQDFADAILLRLSDQQARLKLLRVIHESLGDEIQEANDIRFDHKEALNLTRQVLADMLPVVDVPPNSGISNIRYSINIDACVPAITLGELDFTRLFCGQPG
ncbi:MAG: hypothetical protein A2Z95_08070 [Gallionellales bacterium GWA2_60_18]|nr:MAG: hypothetical protein A2Z95_08070 [Gallionellales bacterium GWA2_60_18]